jgi:hypothetical protein
MSTEHRPTRRWAIRYVGIAVAGATAAGLITPFLPQFRTLVDRFDFVTQTALPSLAGILSGLIAVRLIHRWATRRQAARRLAVPLGDAAASAGTPPIFVGRFLRLGSLGRLDRAVSVLAAIAIGAVIGSAAEIGISQVVPGDIPPVDPDDVVSVRVIYQRRHLTPDPDDPARFVRQLLEATGRFALLDRPPPDGGKGICVVLTTVDGDPHTVIIEPHGYVGYRGRAYTYNREAAPEEIPAEKYPNTRRATIEAFKRRYFAQTRADDDANSR